MIAMIALSVFIVAIFGSLAFGLIAMAVNAWERVDAAIYLVLAIGVIAAAIALVATALSEGPK